MHKPETDQDGENIVAHGLENIFSERGGVSQAAGTLVGGRAESV